MKFSKFNENNGNENNSDDDSDDESVNSNSDSDSENEGENIDIEGEDLEEGVDEVGDVDDDEIDGGDYKIGGAEDDDDDDDNNPTSSVINPLAPLLQSDDEDDEDHMDESYLQKFNANITRNYISEFHPECSINNYDEIAGLTKIIRDSENNIIDDLHKTLPYLTKYERARVLGQRAKQINSGAKVFVKVPENIIDGYLVAELELAQKRIPFIIRRPTPGGGCEYWNLKDLELIQY